MNWWKDEIQQLRQENAQLKQQLANQIGCCQLIEQYLKERSLKDADISNLPSEYLELLRFKKWVEEQ